MDKPQLVDSILEPVRADIAHFVEVESKITSSVEYEETVLAVCDRLAHWLIPQSPNHKALCQKVGTLKKS